MNNLFIKIYILLLVLSSCKPEVVKYTINGDFSGAAGKYIKIIDMTRPGLAPDSIQLDMGGKFTFEKVGLQPGDYILYFKNADYIRITPLPKDNIIISGNYADLIATYKISGSTESEKVEKILKKHRNTLLTIDTLNRFYMHNQMQPNLDSVIERLSIIRDSVIDEEKRFLQDYIKNNPGTFASYIALSQKIGQNLNLFTLENDLQYFEMVDTALYNRFDTIAIVRMLNGYIKRGKIQLKQNETQKSLALVGTIAPNIILPNPYGDTLNLELLRGKFVLVDFWGSWCRPCRLEHPNLRKAYWWYRNRGFEVFQVAIEHNKTDWINTIREDKLKWKNHVSDLNYMESQTARNYNVKSLPANYLLNPKGEIIAQNIYGEALLNKLSEIFSPKPKPAPVATKTDTLSE